MPQSAALRRVYALRLAAARYAIPHAMPDMPRSAADAYIVNMPAPLFKRRSGDAGFSR